MESATAAVASAYPGKAQVDVEVLVVGAGVTGIYQLYRLVRRATPRCWSRPAAVLGYLVLESLSGGPLRLGSYTYGYLFSKELFQEWTAGALRRAAGDRALLQSRGRTGLICGDTFASIPGSRRPRTRVVGNLGGPRQRWIRGEDRDPSQRDRSSLAAVLPRGPGTREFSEASLHTACGRRPRLISQASGSPVSGY